MKSCTLIHYWILHGLLIYQAQHSYQDAITDQTLEQTKEEVKEMILDGEDMYLRAMTILMEAGVRYFCWSLELEPENILNINYKVDIYL